MLPVHQGATLRSALSGGTRSAIIAKKKPSGFSLIQCQNNRLQPSQRNMPMAGWRISQPSFDEKSEQRSLCIYCVGNLRMLVTQPLDAAILGSKVRGV